MARSAFERAGGGRRAGPWLTAVGEREALSVASCVAAEGEQQGSGAQAQRPRRRRMGAVEGTKQIARRGVAQLQPVPRISQLEETEGEL